MGEPEKSDAEYEKEVNDRVQAIQGMLNQGKADGALPQALDNPPTGTKNQAIKDKNCDMVINVLSAIKDAQIEATIEGLSPEQTDTLMKYIYRGLESGENSSSLLKWHESCTKKGGLGCIVRAISARKTV